MFTSNDSRGFIFYIISPSFILMRFSRFVTFILVYRDLFLLRDNFRQVIKPDAVIINVDHAHFYGCQSIGFFLNMRLCPRNQFWICAGVNLPQLHRSHRVTVTFRYRHIVTLFIWYEWSNTCVVVNKLKFYVCYLNLMIKLYLNLMSFFSVKIFSFSLETYIFKHCGLAHTISFTKFRW